MNLWVAYWNIMVKDMRTYYLKPPNISWGLIFPVAWTAMVSTFQGLFIAVSVSEVFEAQAFSNFFRFPMIFLCGLFFPIDALPIYLRPLSYLVPLTYGADILHGAIFERNMMPIAVDFLIITCFCFALFYFSLRNIHKKWII